MLRYSSITITSDTYTGVLPEVAREAEEVPEPMAPRAAVGSDSGTAGLPQGRMRERTLLHTEERPGDTNGHEWAPRGSNPEPAD